MNTRHEPSTLVAAIVPALNEARSIAVMVRAISEYAKPIVVDDGSTDGTGELARLEGADVVVHEQNLGYDRALESGLLRAIELGFEYAITLDGDGQHTATTLRSFVEALVNGADLVVGIRDRHQRFAESIFAFVGSRLWGISDPLCGMKGYRLRSIVRAGRLSTYKSIGTELAIQIARSELRIDQVTVKTQERNGVSRFGSGIKPNVQILKALALGLFGAKW